MAPSKAHAAAHGKSNRPSSQAILQQEDAQDPEPLWQQQQDNEVPSVLPRLIVFDLDNTLWTPELYQLRLPSNAWPQAGRDICLFADARRILTDMLRNPLWKDVKLAIASRTNRVEWAHELLRQFRVGAENNDRALESLFCQVEIIPRSKLTHFERLKGQLKISYGDMLFFDDNVSMNCQQVSRLGVLSCHTPRGLTVELFLGALQRYATLKTENESSWMGEIVTYNTLGRPSPTSDNQPRRAQGVIKTYFPSKRYGFLTELAENSGKGGGNKRLGDFFFHESQIPANFQVRMGAKVQFEANYNPSSGKWAATILQSLEEEDDDDDDNDLVEMPCFSMSQPFTALLLHGVKTVESRKYPMLENAVAPGTRVLVHCARADWPHPEDPVEQLRQVGFTDTDMNRLLKMPTGFTRGSIVGLVTVGQSFVARAEEKQTMELQRRVVANAANIGTHCTEILDAQWLKRPVKRRGNRGVYTAFIPASCLPD